MPLKKHTQARTHTLDVTNPYILMCAATLELFALCKICLFGFVCVYNLLHMFDYKLYNIQKIDHIVWSQHTSILSDSGSFLRLQSLVANQGTNHILFDWMYGTENSSTST